MSPPGSMATNAPSGLLCHPHPPVADTATIEPPSSTEVPRLFLAGLLLFCRPPPQDCNEGMPIPPTKGNVGGKIRVLAEKLGHFSDTRADVARGRPKRFPLSP